ncbi:zinc-ribbon domain-containing protein [Candidatus Woesearchaeota archaeon]|nr:zinc-ribbon domain-containing protein [Candidatus Woesearchaeota archaeon]
MKCKKCGNELTKDDLYCSECGHKVDHDEKHKEKISFISLFTYKRTAVIISILFIVAFLYFIYPTLKTNETIPPTTSDNLKKEDVKVENEVNELNDEKNYLKDKINVRENSIFNKNCENGVCENECSAVVSNDGDNKVRLSMEISFRSDDKLRFGGIEDVAVLEPYDLKKVSFSYKQDELLNIDNCEMKKSFVKFTK